MTSFVVGDWVQPKDPTHPMYGLSAQVVSISTVAHDAENLVVVFRDADDSDHSRRWTLPARAVCRAAAETLADSFRQRANVEED